MSKDIQSYFFFVGCQVVRMVFAAVGMALLARLLGPAGLGHWTMITAAAVALHLFFINWVQQEPLVRFGKEEWVKTGSLKHAWNARLPIMAAGIVASVVLFLWLPQAWLTHFFELPKGDGFLALCFFLGLVASTETQATLQTTGRMARLAFLPVLVSASSALLYVILYAGDARFKTVAVSLVGTCFITVAVWGFAGLLEYKQEGLGFARADRKLMKEMVHFAWPILPATVLGYVMNWGNQVIIQQFFQAREVGFYQTAFQIHSVIVTSAVPLSTVILPKLIGKNVQDPQIMKRYVQTFTPAIFCLWMLAVIPLIAVLPALFIRVFGSAFSDSVTPLKALLISTPLCALGQLYTVLYSVQKRLGQIIVILAMMVACNLLGALSVLPEKGIFGVACAFSGSFVISQFLTYALQHRHMRESVSRMNALVLLVLIFSVGQFFLSGLLIRIAWAGVSLSFVIFTVRALGLIDDELLRRLFAGALTPVGAAIAKVLVPPKKGASV